MRLHTLLLLATTLVSVPATVVAAPFTALHVFGDSLSDNGNASILVGGLLPAAPYMPGRASNGPVAAEYLAAALGLPLTPALAPGGGTNYAVIGAATGPVALPTPADPDNLADNLAETYGTTLPASTGLLNGQVPAFLTIAPSLPSSAITDALFFVWGGANDLGITFDRGPEADPNVPIVAAARIGAVLDLLYGAGARHFLVPNLPDLGLTPDGEGNPLATIATQAFNQALDAQLASRRALWSDAQVFSFDTFALVNHAIADPALYGFSDVSQPCYVGPPLGAGVPTSVCMDDDAYLFWDGTHPTTRAHARLGQAFAETVRGEAVPEPVTLLLTAMGVATVMRRRRR